MAFSKDDLELVLSVDADTNKAELVLRDFARGLGFNLSKGAGDAFGASLKLFQKSAGGGLLDAVGGALGGALGGIVGNAKVGKMLGQVLAQLLPQTLAAPARMATAALQGVSGALRSLAGELGPIGLGFDTLSAALGKGAAFLKSIPLLGEILGPLAEELAQVPAILKQITASLTQFAALANPGVYEQFQWALKDTMGVLGQAFLPALELLTRAARAFGDVLASFLPNATEVRAALEPLRGVFEQLRDALQPLGPLLREFLLASLRIFAQVLANLVRVLTLAIQALRVFNPLLSSLVGGAPRSSWGAAARGASFSGFDEYSRKLQLAAYTSGPSDMTVPVDVNNISKDVNKIAGWTDAFSVQSLAGAIGQAIAQLLNIDPHGVTAAVQAAAGVPAAAFSGGGNALPAAFNLGQSMGQKIRELFGG